MSGGPNGSDGTKGGLRFAGSEAPDYWDFLYFSYAIGTAYTTSDTSVESRTLRRAVLFQSIVSFVFTTVMIGVLINAISSLS
jgi:uncharacterized membrane protein